MNFANLEKVEVLGLPGVEGELRVRGDKTVSTLHNHNLLELFGKTFSTLETEAFQITSLGLY